MYDEPLIGEMGRYIYRAHISADYFINFADAGAREHPDASLVWHFGRRIGDERMMAFGRFLNHKREPSSAGSAELLLALPDLFEPAEGISDDDFALDFRSASP